MHKQNLATIFGWEDCPETIRRKVGNILAFHRQSLKNNLIGFYLHGSLAMGCFNPLKSDIDFLAVVGQKMTTPQKKTVIDYLLDIDNDQAISSPEMSIVTQDSLNNLTYPPSFELHYSQTWRDCYRDRNVDFEEPRYDADLVMHYIAIRESSICLYGPPANEIFPAVPREMRIASLSEELNWISERVESLPLSYIVLNPCRAIALLTEGVYLSKKEGGEWALSHLPKDFSRLINRALFNYSTGTTAHPPDGETINKFLDFSKKEIQGYQINTIQKE